MMQESLRMVEEKLAQVKIDPKRRKPWRREEKLGFHTVWNGHIHCIPKWMPESIREQMIYERPNKRHRKLSLKLDRRDKRSMRIFKEKKAEKRALSLKSARRSLGLDTNS